MSTKQKTNIFETVFNDLSNIFNNKGNMEIDNNSFFDETKDGKHIISASSKEELNDKKTELQQQYYLQNQANSITKNADIQTVQANSLRMPAYVEFMLMESYPIIAQALNVIATEATTHNNGKMLNIYSNNNRLKEDLEHLFYDKLEINTILPFWCRNLCKFGDNFVYLLTEKGKGVVGVKQLPTSEIERIEKLENNKGITKFSWKQGGQEFTDWQVAHFRLLGDEKTLPYGTSILAPVRIYYRLLKMSEDNMLIFRMLNSYRQKVVKVNVGNIDDNDIPMYMQQTISRFKKSQLVDPNTGNLNYKYNVATALEDIFIPVRNTSDPNPIDIIEPITDVNISDIEYLRDNLLTGLGVPKNRLNFTDGENSESSSHTDLFFSRKIMRIQNALIQELNKIAVIHLYLLGYHDEDIRDFKLSLNNPSQQAELLRLESLNQKIDLYTKLVTPNDRGISAYSETKAKREIFGFSDDEILDDINQQLVENIVGDQIKNAGLTYKSAGVLDKVEEYIRKGILNGDVMKQQQPTPEGGEMPNPNEPEAQQTPPEPETMQEKFVYRHGKLNDEMVQLLKEMSEK